MKVLQYTITNKRSGSDEFTITGSQLLTNTCPNKLDVVGKVNSDKNQYSCEENINYPEIDNVVSMIRLQTSNILSTVIEAGSEGQIFKIEKLFHPKQQQRSIIDLVFSSELVVNKINGHVECLKKIKFSEYQMRFRLKKDETITLTVFPST